MGFFDSVSDFAKGAINLVNAGKAQQNSDRQYDLSVKNLELQKEGLESSKKMNAENIALQKELNDSQLAYARNLNSLTMAREDNAHQREVADLRNAGLSPFATMNGSGAGDFTTPSLNAPQNDIGSISSQLGNIGTAYGMAQSASQNANISAFNMLGYIQNEEKITNQKNIDEGKLALANDQYALDKILGEADKKINELRYQLDSNINYGKLANETKLTDSQAEQLASAVKLSSAQQAKTLAETTSVQVHTNIAEQQEHRDSESFGIEMKIKQAEYDSMIMNYNNDIIKHALENGLLRLNINSTQQEVEHYMDYFKMDKKRTNWTAFRDAMIGISAGLNSISDIAQAVASFTGKGGKIGF